MIKKILYQTSHLVNNNNLRKSILDTLNLINKAASVTLGPRGKLVAIQAQLDKPRLTKDGVTVVKHIQFDQRLQNAILTLVKNAANNANKYSGDGTTTTTLLVCQIIKISMRLGLNQMNQKDVRKGFQIAKNLGLQFLQQISRKAITEKQLFHVSMISTNSDKKLSKLISEAVMNSKQIKIQKSNSSQCYLEYVNGTKITRGIPNELLINKINKIQFNYPIVLVSLKKIQQVKQILPVLQKAKNMKKQLIIFAPDISESVTSMIYYNYSKKIIESCPIRIPGTQTFSQELLMRIGKITDSFIFSEHTLPIQEINFSHFGKCIRVIIDEYQTTLLTKSNMQDKNCVIYIGSPNQTYTLQLYDKAVDALNSTKSAQLHGVVPGGGISYLRISQLLQNYKDQNFDVQAGIKCLKLALKAPFQTLSKLSQINYIKQTKGWQGYDFKQNKIVNMYQKGIIDSLNVAKNCLIDSVSLASMLISLEMGVVLDTKYKETDYANYKGKFSL